MSEKKRFLELDVFRGIAALWVAMFHFTLRFDQAFLDQPIPLKPFLDGTYGVQLFFMISGFVILMTLQRSRSAVDFAVHRFARLYPAYWLSLALACLLITLAPLPNQVLTPVQVAANATMVQRFLFIGDIDGVYWSLAVELAFYALMIGVFLCRAVHRILFVCCAWLVVVALWRASAAMGVYLPGRVGELLIVQYAQFFVCGIVFFDAWSRDDWKPIHTLLLVASVLTQASIVGVWKTIPMLLFCAMFALAITGRMTAIRKPFLIWLGVISYPFYLTHQMIGYRVIRLGDDLGMSRFLFVPVAIVASLAVAALINKAVEKPALRAIRGWYDRGGVNPKRELAVGKAAKV
ncbi:acyltransferase family protein [Roseiterribacter gracilis]|uniref:Acyltransferase n=1 Tax=Roseiterribacter gracilis TaxID=2812848 RepID=A0A8S8X9Y5_9PROT|nr:acyltransferase [Rhodospirillales bacterium TMPK1]